MPVDMKLGMKSLHAKRPDLFELKSKLDGMSPKARIIWAKENQGTEEAPKVHEIHSYLHFLRVLDSLEEKGLIEIHNDHENGDFRVSLAEALPTEEDDNE